MAASLQDLKVRGTAQNQGRGGPPTRSFGGVGQHQHMPLKQPQHVPQGSKSMEQQQQVAPFIRPCRLMFYGSLHRLVFGCFGPVACNRALHSTLVVFCELLPALAACWLRTVHGGRARGRAGMPVACFGGRSA